MVRTVLILLALAAVVALPFVFRRQPPAGDWREGDPQLVIVSPHNEAIRYEFALAFSRWHQERFGRPVKIDWRSIGGTTEITRYLTSEFTASARAWWQADGRTWPAAATDDVFSRNASKDSAVAAIVSDVRKTDDPTKITSHIDLFFGGGFYDHDDLWRRGMTVPPWSANQQPRELFYTDDGFELIPTSLSGEAWRNDHTFGTALSTFGIVANLDRLSALNLPSPTQWDELADPRLFRAVGLADPTKSGSIAKVFEMIIHQKIRDRVLSDGFTEQQIEQYEQWIEQKKPFAQSTAYEASISAGWIDGVRLLQLIGANARYFTDAASKVPIDVSIGDAAVGMAIDFYGRYQAQMSQDSSGRARMTYVTPIGGSSVSADPISLLRGAPHREVAVAFIRFCLSEEGQRLWVYQPGSPGGPEKFALRRLPIRADFYPSTRPAINVKAAEHARYAVDAIADPSVNPYELAKAFVYHSRWTSRHFGVQRDLVRAMCMDSGDELRAAWNAIRQAGGPKAVPAAFAQFQTMPTIRLENLQTGQMDDVPLTWSAVLTLRKETYRPMDYTQAWTEAFRANYRKARRLVAGAEASH